MTSQVPCPSSEPDQMIPNWKWLCWQCCWKNYKSIVNKQTDPQLIPVRCYWWRSLNGSSSIGNVVEGMFTSLRIMIILVYQSAIGERNYVPCRLWPHPPFFFFLRRLKQLQNWTEASNFRQGQGRLTRISPKQISTEPRTGFVVGIVWVGGGGVVGGHLEEFWQMKRSRRRPRLLTLQVCKLTRIHMITTLQCSISPSCN